MQRVLCKQCKICWGHRTRWCWLHCVLETALPTFSQSCPTVFQISDKHIKITDPQSSILSNHHSVLTQWLLCLSFWCDTLLLSTKITGNSLLAPQFAHFSAIDVLIRWQMHHLFAFMMHNDMCDDMCGINRCTREGNIGNLSWAPWKPTSDKIKIYQ